MPVPIITRDPETLRGAPCFRGTRVPFRALLDYLEDGKYTLNDFLEDFPSVTKEAAIQALEESDNRKQDRTRA